MTLSDVDDFRKFWQGHRCMICNAPIMHSMAVSTWIHAFKEDFSAEHSAVKVDDAQREATK